MGRFSRKNKHLAGGQVSFPLVLKQETRGNEAYSTWIRNHRWNSRTERWCKIQLETIAYQPRVGVLMQCANPNLEFLRESLASIVNQIYPFHELSIVDRGSSDPRIRTLLGQVEADPRVKISYQKGSERDIEAIAQIMKKSASEWILLMGAEDILEPNALYNMVGSLQNSTEIDFVFSDSDMIDDNGLRFDPQLKPVWAVGAHYPLGYYQHPVLLHDRIVKKLKGHERICALMDEGTLLDEASNHSRFVAQAPGILYHGRSRGRKNETPPEPLNNVLLNENFQVENGQINIDILLRGKAEPKVPLNILWVLDSLERDDAPIVLFHYARYLAKDSGHRFAVVARKDGPLRSAYEKICTVTIASEDLIDETIAQTHNQSNFDVALVSSIGDFWFPKAPADLDIPALWLLHPGKTDPKAAMFQHPATIAFLSSTIAQRCKQFDSRNVSRVLPAGVDLMDLKVFKQRNSPFDLRAKLGIKNSSAVFLIAGPTIARKGQKTFVQAALETLERNPDAEIDFILAGGRSGEYQDEIQKLIEQSGRSERFHQFPETDDVFQYYPYYLIADVCVSCSADEVFPLTTLEAMAMKKTVIGTQVFSTTEVIEQDENGYLLPPGDVNELAEKMDFLVKKPEFRDFFGRRSLEIIYEKFQFRKVVTRLEDLLRESIVYEP